MAPGSKRSSGAEDVMDTVSVVPWWADLMLAVLAYVVLSFVASRPITFFPDPGKAVPGVIRVMVMLRT
jgi:hypothetical protein